MGRKTKTERLADARRRAAMRRRRLRSYAASAKAAERLEDALVRDYGMTRVADTHCLSRGAFYIEDTHGSVRIVFTLDDSSKVRSAMERARPRRRPDIFSPMQYPVSEVRERTRRGGGFGCGTWRNNLSYGGVELCLAGDPCDGDRRFLEYLGFTWNNLVGRWYKGRDDGFTKSDAVDIAARRFNLKKACDAYDREEVA